MNIHLERSFFVYSHPEKIVSWLEKWGPSQGFQTAGEETTTFALTRGSHWWAGISMDIRKIPTKLSVALKGSHPCLLSVALVCKSPLSMQTPGDKAKLEKDLFELEDHLWSAQKVESFREDLTETDKPGAVCGTHPSRSGVVLCERCGQ